MGEEIPCPSCGAALYPDDRAFVDCDCGTRMWFREDLKEQFGSSVPRRFQPGPDGEFSEPKGDDEDDDRQGKFGTDF